MAKLKLNAFLKHSECDLLCINIENPINGRGDLFQHVFAKQIDK